MANKMWGDLTDVSVLLARAVTSERKQYSTRVIRLFYFVLSIVQLKGVNY